MIDIIFEADEPVLAPTRAHDTDAGWDLKTDRDFELYPDEATVVNTGVKVNIPNGHVGYLHVRSSLGAKYGIQLANGTGIIDAGYTGYLRAVLINHGEEGVAFNKYDRVVQIVIHKLPEVRFIAGEITKTDRGANGFGSTGR